MPVRRTELVAGQYYHLYNRGNNYEKVFIEQENYSYFLSLWQKYIPENKTQVISYCLMPDHYHFLVILGTDQFSRLMQPFLLAYTNAFNRRFHRIGALFQGRFKCRPVARFDYLLHLSRYIHLNPVKRGLVEKPEDWKFSSYREYVLPRSGSFARPEIVLEAFGSVEAYREFVEEDVLEPKGFKDLVLE